MLAWAPWVAALGRWKAAGWESWLGPVWFVFGGESGESRETTTEGKGMRERDYDKQTCNVPLKAAGLESWLGPVWLVFGGESGESRETTTEGKVMRERDYDKQTCNVPLKAAGWGRGWVVWWAEGLGKRRVGGRERE